MNYPYLPANEIERAADGLLTRAFGRDIPVPVDLETVLFDVLAEQEELAFDDENILGYQDGDRILGRMGPFQNQIEICATLKEPHGEGRLKGRYRFTVCHEIGHWILHRPLHLRSSPSGSRGQLGSEDAQFHMVSLNRNIFSSDVKPPPEEVQANRFAARLLIPGSLLRREFVRRFGTPQVVADPGSTAYETAMELAHRTTQGTLSLCDAFEASRPAMAIVLESGGYVTDEPTFL